VSQKVAQKFGKYEIIGELGQGGMGVVYKARDPAIGRLVALKTLTPELLSDPELLRRFYREARSAGNLQHPNIVTIYDLGESEGRPYIAMEFVEGESLQKIIARQDPIPLALKLRIISQCCQGLDHAHKHGVIHRDVKPANILVKSDGTAKVVDFGIAHLESTTITKTGVFMGTVHYSSPEQLNDGRVDVRSDVWSIAVVLYEFLAYRRAFEGANFASLIAKVLNTDPEPLTRFCPEVPPALEALIFRCLRKNPDERPQSLDELLLDLTPIEASLSQALVPELISQAQDLKRKGELSKAQERVRSALMLDSAHAEAKSLMSQITAEIKALEASSKLFQLVNEGERLLKQGEYVEALHVLSDALRLDPRDERALALRDAALKERERQKEAREAIAAGEKAFKQGDLTGAEVELQKALQLDPKNRRAASLLDLIREDRTTRERSFELKEAIWEAENRLAEGQYEEALVRLEELQKKFPDDAKVQQLLKTARQKAAEPAGHGEQWLDEQLMVAGHFLEAQDFVQATRVLSDAHKQFPNEPRIQQLFDRVKAETHVRAAPIVQPAPQAASVSPPAQTAKSKLPVVIVAIVVAVLAIGGALIYFELGHHHHQPSTATALELQLQQEAQQLLQQGELEAALARWKTIEAQHGVLATLAQQEIIQIQKVEKKEQNLFAQAQAAQSQKKWDDAIALYQQVADLNGALKTQSLQAIANVKALQSGQDLTTLEQQKFAQAQTAFRRQDYSRARDLFEQVVNLNVPGSKLLPQARHQLATLESRLQEQQEFNAAVQLQNSGQLAQAKTQFQVIVQKRGALEGQAQTHLQQIDELIANQQKQKQQAAALEASLQKFKDLEAQKQYGEARAMLVSISQQGGNTGQLENEVNALEQSDFQKLTDRFAQAESSKNASGLQQLAAQFQALARQGGPIAGAARDYATRLIPAAIQQITAAAKPAASVSSPPVATAPSRAPVVTVVTSGTYRPWQGPLRKGQLLPEYNIDGGLKAISLHMPPVANAPAGSFVTIKVNIDEQGNVTPDHIVQDASGIGAEVLDAAKSWKFQPPRVRGKPVRTSILVKVQF
jgi:TonB family protein